MSRPLYDLSSLPSTLSMMSPAGRRRKEADSIALLQNENIQDCLKVDVSGDPAEDLDGKLNKCDKIDESPTEKNVSTIKNDSTKDRNFFRRIARVSEEEEVMFCSPFRRRRRRRVEEVEERQLSREEAWHLYLAKLEEEANYFSVSESSEETELCTCQTCIAGYEMLYSQYLDREETQGDQGTVELMQAILKVNTKKSCDLM